jgi:hypothetical protein
VSSLQEVIERKRFILFAIFAGTVGIVIGGIVIAIHLLNFWQ